MAKILREGNIPKDASRSKVIILIASIFCLFIFQLFGFSNVFFSYIDVLLKPFVINLRNFSRDAAYLYKFMLNADLIINENLELKQKLLDYENLLRKNHELNKWIETELKLKQLDPKLVDYNFVHIGRITGVKNLYSNTPVFKIYITSKDYVPKKWDVITLGNSIFLGFIWDFSGSTAIASAFYSEQVLREITIPVYNLRDNTIKGLVVPIQRGEIFIKNVSTNKEVREGDLWITSNEAFEVPTGLIVGKTNYVIQNKNTGFNEVNISLIFEPNDLNHVYVIRN